jgi:hypothetical protein
VQVSDDLAIIDRSGALARAEWMGEDVVKDNVVDNA